MICMRGVFVIQRPNELWDLEAGLLNMVCKDLATEPVLQDVGGEQLTRGSNKRRMQNWICMYVVFGSLSDQPFLMSGIVTRMLNPIGTSSRSKYIVYTRMRKSVNSQVECSISNMEHSPLLFLQQLVEFERSA